MNEVVSSFPNNQPKQTTQVFFSTAHVMIRFTNDNQVSHQTPQIFGMFWDASVTPLFHTLVNLAPYI